MPSGRTLSARTNPGVQYNGVNLSSQPVQYQAPKTNSIADAIGSAQQGQNAANVANNTRYNQGLGVLTSGYANSQGQIAQALKDTDYLGNKQLNDIRLQEQQGHASTQQSAINRGIGNTTILDSLQQGVAKTADEGRLGVRDMVAKNRSAINLQGAANTNQGANSIASFIGARNDNAPSLSEYANLVNAAAQNGPASKSTATLTKGSINDPINFGSQSGPGQIQVPQAGGGGALNAGQFITGGTSGALGGGMNNMQIGMGGGGGGGSSSGGAGQFIQGGSGGGVVSQALNNQIPGANASDVMTQAGYGPGSINLFTGDQKTPPPAQSSAPAQPTCRKFNYIFDSGRNPSDPEFCK